MTFSNKMSDWIYKKLPSLKLYGQLKNKQQLSNFEAKNSHSRIYQNGWQVEVVDRYGNIYLMNQKYRIVKVINATVDDENKLLNRKSSFDDLIDADIVVNKNVSSEFLSYIDIDDDFIRYQKHLEKKDVYVYKSHRQREEENEEQREIELLAQAIVKAQKMEEENK